MSDSYAKLLLSQEGINLSVEGIRKIWQKYGLIGYKKGRLTLFFTRGVQISSTTESAIKQAEYLLEQKGNLNEAVRILNRVPCCPNLEILEKIPYRYLSPRCRLEKLHLFISKEPMNIFYKRARDLRQKLEKEGFIYSSLRAGLSEANALFWLGKVRETIPLIEDLEKKTRREETSALRFTLLSLKGISYFFCQSGQPLQYSWSLFTSKDLV